MKLIFFDETKDDPDYPHYHLGAVCIDETALASVEEQINSLADETFGTKELSADTEFHANEIFHRAKHFKEWPFEERIRLLGRFIEILARAEVQRIDVQINCARLYGSQQADELAFMFLCEKANDLLRSRNSLGMLIGDRQTDRLATRYARTLSRYRESGTDFQYGRDIANLVDSAHFTHSHLSRFLQLADVYAWLLQFRVRNRESTNFRHRAVLDLLQSPPANGLWPSKYKEWPPA